MTEPSSDHGGDERRSDGHRPGHVPVLPAEVLEGLAPGPGETIADATVGMGGHAVAIAERLGPSGTLVINDVDPDAIERSRARLADELGGGLPRVVAVRGNFARLADGLRREGVGPVDGVLADLGFSSAQMDDPSRGLSFRFESSLDMRLDPGLPATAGELVNELPERELRSVFERFGEEPSSARVARKVVEARASGPISSTAQLATIVRDAVSPRGKPGARRPGRTPGIDPATRVFQALRIAVNDELGSLDRFLAQVARNPGGWLAEGARVAVISFHSLEDRAVKRSFASLVSEGRAEHVTRKPVVAGEAEVSSNPRSRSAKLRTVRLVAVGADGGGAAG